MGLELGQLITQGVIGLFQVPFLEFHALHVFCQGADLGLMLVGWGLVRRIRWIEPRTQLQAAQTSTSSSSPPFLLHLPPGHRVEGHSSGDPCFRLSRLRGQYPPAPSVL